MYRVDAEQKGREEGWKQVVGEAPHQQKQQQGVRQMQEQIGQVIAERIQAPDCVIQAQRE